MIAVTAIGCALWWFLVGWMVSGGFARIAIAAFERRTWREVLVRELRILRAPFRPLEEPIDGPTETP